MKINKTIVFESFEEIKHILEAHKEVIYGDSATLDFSLIFPSENIPDKFNSFVYDHNYIELLPEDLRELLPSSYHNFSKYLEINSIINNILNKYYKSKDKISAIKEFRAASGLYLKESKDIIEYLLPIVKPNI